MEIVLSNETRFDDYGNFWFKDKGDKEHKIGTKRESFDELCATVADNPGKAVSLRFDTFNKIDYIVGIELLEKQNTVGEAKLKEQRVKPPDKPSVSSTGKTAPQPSIRENMEWKDRQIEANMWWKMLGDRIGDGSLDEHYPKIAVRITTAYYERMAEITGVNFKEE